MAPSQPSLAGTASYHRYVALYQPLLFRILNRTDFYFLGGKRSARNSAGCYFFLNIKQSRAGESREEESRILENWWRWKRAGLSPECREAARRAMQPLWQLRSSPGIIFHHAKFIGWKNNITYPNFAAIFYRSFLVFAPSSISNFLFYLTFFILTLVVVPLPFCWFCCSCVIFGILNERFNT